MQRAFKKIIERLKEKKSNYNAETEAFWNFREAIEIVNQVASEYGGGWIPCSKRLPEKNGWYLVTNNLGVVQQQYWCASHWGKLRDDAVVAWCPLPEPYKAESEE